MGNGHDSCVIGLRFGLDEKKLFLGEAVSFYNSHGVWGEMVTRSVSEGPRRSRYVPRSRVGLLKQETSSSERKATLGKATLRKFTAMSCRRASNNRLGCAPSRDVFWRSPIYRVGRRTDCAVLLTVR